MDNAPINDEVTTLPCCECGEPKTVNVVYLPYKVVLWHGINVF